MAKGKTPPHKVVMTEGKREIVRSLLAEYDIKDAHDIQEVKQVNFLLKEKLVRGVGTGGVCVHIIL